MKRLLILLLFCVLQAVQAQTPVSPSAAATAAPTTVSADEKAVIETEKQRFAAQVSKDYATLDKVLADDLLYTHSHGGNDTKQAYIQSFRDGKLNYETINAEEQKARLYGNTAVINGICFVKAVSNGNVINSRLRYLSVYVRKANQWQLVAWQSLRL
jgi:hypothetical protein